MPQRSENPSILIIIAFVVSILGAIVLVGSVFFGREIMALTSFAPITPSSSSVAPKETVVVTFPKPVLDANYRQRITIAPKRALYAKWEENNTRLLLIPKTSWEPGVKYTLQLPEGNDTNFFAGNPQATEFSFSVTPHPRVVDILPKNGEKDVVVGVEDPIVVTFDAPTTDFWIDFAFSPEVDAIFQNNPEKTRFEVLPKTPLLAGTSYTLTLFSHVADDTSDESREVASTAFTTLPVAPKEVSSDFTERIEDAKRFTQPQITEGKYIDIHIDSQVMTLFENGRAVDAYIISSGKRGMDTPKGSFQIRNKHPRPWSKAYSLYMPYWMAITPDGKYGIHELPEWPGGYKEGANHLGTPVSHGCVRLGVGSAERVYTWAEVGMPVIIH